LVLDIHHFGAKGDQIWTNPSKVGSKTPSRDFKGWLDYHQ